jgi:hypothetical protein
MTNLSVLLHRKVKNMKTKIIALCIILATLLSACSQKPTDSNQISSGIFTAVAQTLTAQYTPSAATNTPAVTSTAQTITPTGTIVKIPTGTPFVATALANACDNAVFANDVTIPDGTSIVAGATFTKTWSIKNTGTCAWSSAYSLKFVSGSQMSGATTAISSAVAAGNNANISIAMTAPTTAGTYAGYWRMVNASGGFFGGLVSVNIVVPAYTATPTLTITPTPTITPVPTNTPFIQTQIVVITATTVPTTIPTAVPTVPTDVPTTGS